MSRRLLRIHSPNEGVGMLIWLRVMDPWDQGGKLLRWMTVRITISMSMIGSGRLRGTEGNRSRCFDYTLYHICIHFDTSNIPHSISGGTNRPYSNVYEGWSQVDSGTGKEAS